jgi:hypothetical protein
LDEDQARVAQLDPTAIALMTLSGNNYKHGGYLLCYQRSELAVGRSTVVGFRRALADGTTARRRGDSLATVILEHYADNVRRVENEYNSPYNRGAGSVDRYELEGARENLVLAEELVRRVADRRRPKLVP